MFTPITQTPDSEVFVYKAGEHLGTGVYIGHDGSFYFWAELPSNNRGYIGGFDTREELHRFMEGYYVAISHATAELREVG